jgi:hypothetical protein
MAGFADARTASASGMSAAFAFRELTRALFVRFEVAVDRSRRAARLVAAHFRSIAPAISVQNPMGSARPSFCRCHLKFHIGDGHSVVAHAIQT